MKTSKIWFKAIINGSCFGLVGTLVAIGIFFPVFSEGTGEGWSAIFVFACVSSFLLGIVVWRAIMPRAKKASVGLGILVGALVGLLSHPLTWYLASVYNFIQGNLSSLGEPPPNPLEGLWIALVLSITSLLFVGWITIVIGALLGSILGYIHKRRLNT